MTHMPSASELEVNSRAAAAAVYQCLLDLSRYSVMYCNADLLLKVPGCLYLD